VYGLNRWKGANEVSAASSLDGVRRGFALFAFQGNFLKPDLAAYRIADAGRVAVIVTMWVAGHICEPRAGTRSQLVVSRESGCSAF